MSESPIFEGILSDARLKAEKVIEKAQKEAGDILKEAEDKAEKTREEERKNTKMRLDALSLKEESAVRSLERLRELRNNDAAYNAVQKEVDSYFDSYFLKDESRSTLIAWIAEAAYGLGYRQAKVAYNPKEKVDESMLRQAEKLLMEKTGFGKQDDSDQSLGESTADMSAAMMRDMPLRSILSFSDGAFTPEMLEDVLRRLNG